MSTGLSISAHRRRAVLRGLPIWVTLATIVTGCSDEPTAPQSVVALHRTVRVVVTDSLGATAAGVAVRMVSEFDSAGIAYVVQGITDAQGAMQAVLIEGNWGVQGFLPPRVAGATFAVPGRTRPPVDTIQVALELHRASVARGRARLTAHHNHSGIVIDCPPVPAAQVTDSTGTYVIPWLPVGHWTITMFAPGYRLGSAPIDVTVPGQSLGVPDVVLALGPFP
ncbi:MAG TPA: hypothetical protein VFQ05_17950 [Candidatus Eisenbacteria bacterium]|nr:hypothetical protein [Candidatus Eisenbacteria bacterium]